MQPTTSRLIRIVPRQALKVGEEKIHHTRSQINEVKRTTLMDMLVKRREGSKDWPGNLRLEPQLTKKAYESVMPEIRSTLKKMTKER